MEDQFDFLLENARVLVTWPESNEQFEGTIQNINDDGSYDITYDALVHGKVCSERRVLPARVTLLEDEQYWDTDQARHVESKVQEIEHPTSAFPMIRRNRGELMHTILKTDEPFDDATHEELTEDDCKELFTSVSIFRAMEMRKINPDRLIKLFEIIVEKIRHMDDEHEREDIDFYEETFSVHKLQPLQNSMICCTLAIRLFLVLSERTSHKTSSRGSLLTSLPEVIIEQNLAALHKMFSNNFSDKQSAAERLNKGNASPSRTGNTSTLSLKDLLKRKVIDYVGKVFSPVCATFLDTLKCFIQRLKPNGSIGLLVVEYAFDIVKMDPGCNKLVALLDTKFHYEMLQLIRSAVGLVRSIFYHHESFRSSILLYLIASIHMASQQKSAYRPFLIDLAYPKDNPHITPSTMCLMTCIQCLTKEPKISKVNDDMLHDCYRMSASIVSEIIQRATTKESSGEYFQVLQHLIMELVVSVQSPHWPSSSLLLEQVVVGLLKHLQRLVDDSQSDVKRDVGQINHILDLLGNHAEKIRQITIEPFQSVPNDPLVDQIQDILKARIQGKWKNERPLWLTEIADKESTDYWNVNSESELESEEEEEKAVVRGKSKKKGKSKPMDSAELLPFVKALDALVEINLDIVDILEEIQIDYDANMMEKLLANGGVAITMNTLPKLHHNYDLDRLLGSVNIIDLQFARVLRHLIEHNHSTTFVLSESYSEFADESLRDAALSILGQWCSMIKQEKRGSEALSAIAQLTVHLTKQEISDYASPNVMMKVKLPKFVSDIKTQALTTVIQMERMVVSHRVLFQLLAKSMDTFLHMTSDGSPQVRAKALKSISRWTTIDPDIMFKENIRKVIMNMLTDKAISVREEVVKIIGPYIATNHSALATVFLHELLPLLVDDGISVRKSVVYILRDILQNQPGHIQYQHLCISLLERLAAPKEEESIKEIIQSIFHQIWFSPPTAHALNVLKKIYWREKDQPVASAEESDTANSTMSHWSQIRPLVTKQNISKRHSEDVYSSIHVESTAIQLVDIVAMEDTHQWISNLLQQLLHGKAEGNELTHQIKAKREESFRHCHQIIQFLVELLLLAEEGQEHFQKFVGNCQKNIHEYKANIIATIALFCESHPPFVSKHLLTFLPYLKGDSNLTPGLNTIVCGHIIRILEATALLERNHLADKCDEIISDLSSIALMQSGKNLSAAISCIALLVTNVTNDASPLFALATRCYNPLVQIAQSVPPLPTSGTDHSGMPLSPTASSSSSLTTCEFSPAQLARIQRCLVVLGYICEHSRKCKEQLQRLSAFHNLDKRRIVHLIEKAAKTELSQSSALDASTFYGSCYAAATFALIRCADQQVQVRAVQALCGVFSGYPRLMHVAQGNKVISLILSDRYSDVVHERFILGIKDMMVSEEKRLEKQATVQQMKDSGMAITTKDSVLGPVDHDSDATVAGFVLQQHLHVFNNFLRHISSSLRYATLQLMATLLRQGMVCPLDVLALIIMLQGDQDASIRHESFLLLQLQDDRHPNFLDNRLLEGVESTFDFQMSTFQKAFPTLPKDDHLNACEVSIFGPLYTSCVQPNRKRKLNFLIGLLRKYHSMFLGSNVKDNVSTPISEVCNSSRELVLNMKHLLSLYHKEEYLAATLSSLPFVNMDEVLQIIYWINRTVPFDLALQLNRLKQMMMEIGGKLKLPNEQSGEDVPDATSVVTTSDAGASTDNPSTPQSSSGMQKGFQSNFQIDAILLLDEDVLHHQVTSANPRRSPLWQQLNEVFLQEMHIRAQEILLRLKAYLKMIYNITDERCMSFDPSEKAAAANANSTQNEKLPPMDMLSAFEFKAAPQHARAIEELFSEECIRCMEPSTPSDIMAKKVVMMMGICVDDYNRINHLINHMETEDFKYEKDANMTTTGAKRGRRPGSTAANNASGGSQKKPSTTKKTTKRKRLTMDFNDDGEEEYDSEEYTNAAMSTPTKKKTPSSASKASGERAGKQRSAKRSVNYAHMSGELNNEDEEFND